MPSKILYDNRDNEIRRCQPKPHGSAGMPSFEGLCRSARIPENVKEYMETCIITNDLLTNEAVDNLRINNGEAIKKPTVNITVDKQFVSLSEPTFTINTEVINMIDSDVLDYIEMNINDVYFEIGLVNNKGNKIIGLTEGNTYKITCVDNHLISNFVEVKFIG